MVSDSRPLILYGVPFSQPVRAVMWLLLYKQTPFEMVLTNPGTTGENGSRHPDFLAKNPGGTIPTIEEPDSGFTLGEAHAILCYLCNKHGWTDLYPADHRQRARVDWYLHFHHRNVREASVGLVAPKIRKDLNIPEAMQQAARATLTRALETLETGWLAETPFLTGETPTIADFAAYVEIGQLQPGFTNVYDFSAFPNVRRWMEALQQVDGHDDVHVVLAELGDISVEPPSMDTIRNANRTALKTLKERLAQLGS
ncbi:MAG TPA: glutathione S-transferase family protein [Pseudomonadales bacterium]